MYPEYDDIKELEFLSCFGRCRYLINYMEVKLAWKLRGVGSFGILVTSLTPKKHKEV